MSEITSAPVPRRAPPAALLGLHRLTMLFLLLQILLVLVMIAAFRWTGLRFAWGELLSAKAVLLVGVWGLWGYQAVAPGRRPADWVITESLLAVALILTFTLITSPLQYAAIALDRPLADGWLAAADAALGIHVPTLVEWTRARPWLSSVLVGAYHSLLPQFVLPIAVLGCWYHDRRALWEYAWHFQMCLLLTLCGLALFPAACAFTFFGFDSLLEQTRFVEQFHGIRTGTMNLVQPSNLEGMITFPSFHVAGGLMVTWAFREHRYWFVGLAVLNVLLIASTVLTGAHYAVDVIATVFVFAFSVWAWRRTGSYWIGEPGAIGSKAKCDGGVRAA